MKDRNKNMGLLQIKPLSLLQITFYMQQYKMKSLLALKNFCSEK